ncbi:MAG: HlyD family efflux transporter periplasmic adaptor subunit [Xenococcaceae cyanobacterium]
MNQSNSHQTNKHHTNDNETNGTRQSSGALVVRDDASSQSSITRTQYPISKFEQAVILRQSPIWSRAILWTIIGVATFGIGWASIAKIEQVVLATGQLKPQGKVKEVQVSINGVVKDVYVEDGDHVQSGELLVTLDSTASVAELESLKNIRQSLTQETQFYRALMEQPLDPVQVERAILQLKLPREVASLARNRTALVAENQLFRVQLGDGDGSIVNLNSDQLARLQAARAELNSRAAAASLEIEQLQKQLNQNQVQLADAKAQLATDRLVLEEITVRNKLAITQAQESLEIEQKILEDLDPLVKEGALARLQYERQRQEVNDRYAALVEQRSTGAIEYDRQQQEVQTRLAEIEQLLSEQQRLRLDITQAKEELTNTTALSEKDVRDQIANNQKQIAEIDSQLTKLVVENEKRIAELNSEVSRAQMTLKYQELRAPVTGTVFDLQAAPGFVPQPSQAEALLKIVPDDNLIAEVFITNEDIGFVRENMKTDVRIDSFPFSEFGDIKGRVISIGSDALPPDEIHRFYRFPAKISLDQQALAINDREIPLQSGMSVSVNIKVREKRTVLSLFTELFTKKVESLKQVR